MSKQHTAGRVEGHQERTAASIGAVGNDRTAVATELDMSVTCTGGAHPSRFLAGPVACSGLMTDLLRCRVSNRTREAAEHQRGVQSTRQQTRLGLRVTDARMCISFERLGQAPTTQVAKKRMDCVRHAGKGPYSELTCQLARGILRATDGRRTCVAKMGPSEPGNKRRLCRRTS